MSFDPNALEKPFDQSRKRVKKWDKNPAPGDVHKLRTNSRRAEAILGAFGFDSGRMERRVLKPLARVRKRAGKIRDMDVQIGHLLDMKIDGEQECVVRVVEALAIQRHNHSRKLNDIVSVL